MVRDVIKASLHMPMAVSAWGQPVNVVLHCNQENWMSCQTYTQLGCHMSPIYLLQILVIHLTNICYYVITLETHWRNIFFNIVYIILISCAREYYNLLPTMYNRILTYLNTYVNIFSVCRLNHCLLADYSMIDFLAINSSHIHNINDRHS